MLVFAGGGCVALAAVGAAAGAGTGFTGILPFGIVEVPTAIGAEDEGFCCRWSLYVAGIGARDVVTIGTVSFDEEAATFAKESFLMSEVMVGALAMVAAENWLRTRSKNRERDSVCLTEKTGQAGREAQDATKKGNQVTGNEKISRNKMDQSGPERERGTGDHCRKLGFMVSSIFGLPRWSTG